MNERVDSMEPEAGTLELMRWIGWAQKKAAAEWIRGREMTREQGFTLGYLVQNPGTSQREIAQISRTSAASVSSMLQGLERRGLVERRADGADVRVKRVFATDEGAELVAGFDVEMREANDTILAPLTQQERQQLEGLLLKITATLPAISR